MTDSSLADRLRQGQKVRTLGRRYLLHAVLITAAIMALCGLLPWIAVELLRHSSGRSHASGTGAFLISAWIFPFLLCTDVILAYKRCALQFSEDGLLVWDSLGRRQSVSYPSIDKVRPARWGINLTLIEWPAARVRTAFIRMDRRMDGLGDVVSAELARRRSAARL